MCISQYDAHQSDTMLLKKIRCHRAIIHCLKRKCHFRCYLKTCLTKLVLYISVAFWMVELLLTVCYNHKINSIIKTEWSQFGVDASTTTTTTTIHEGSQLRTATITWTLYRYNSHTGYWENSLLFLASLNNDIIRKWIQVSFDYDAATNKMLLRHFKWQKKNFPSHMKCDNVRENRNW